MQAAYGHISPCNTVCSPGFDRFIPYRPELDVETSHHRLTSQDCVDSNHPAQYRNAKAEQYSDILADVLGKENGKILPTTPTSKQNRGRLFVESWISSLTSKKTWANRSPKRRISQSPDCIMDMPNLRDDYYTNLLDWGSSNRIAVGLQQTTYVWDPLSKVCRQILMDVADTENYYISAVSWDPEGKFLAVADNVGDILICDIEKIKLVRQFSQEKAPIGVVRWTPEGIFSGNKKGRVNMFDVRLPDRTPPNSFRSRQRDVCGMAMVEARPYFVTGGEEGLIEVWDHRIPKCYEAISGHTACTKALAWCPWRPGVLASGGGSHDGYIRLWQMYTGEQIAEVYTKSQVCGLAWSKDYRELVSSHGIASEENNDIVLWKMRSFEFVPVATLKQHVGRPLHISMSPDKTTLVSAGADEAMCIWNCFPDRKRLHASTHAPSPLKLETMIR